MNKTILAVAALLAAASAARAQTFESRAAESVQAFALEDSFAGVGACGILDTKRLRPYPLDEATDLVKPCLDAVASRYAVKAVAQPGFLSLPQSGQPGKSGLLIMTDMTPGSKAHRDLVASIARREGRLLGHPAKVMTRDEIAPSSISALQKAIDGCMMSTVVRDLRSGGDFVKIYGRCLTRNAELKISEIRPARGLAVTVKIEASDSQVEAYNGFVVVNAGKGPVRIMVVAYGAQVVLK